MTGEAIPEDNRFLFILSLNTISNRNRACFKKSLLI
jgi:hypothetical protein